MKEKLTNNLALKLLSLALAAFLWMVVVNLDDPVTSVQFSNVPVEILHPEVVTSKGKTYQIEDETDTVRVTVRAKRSVLHSLRVHDIKAYADMKEMSLGSQIPIEVSIPGVEYSEAYSNPRNLQVTIEDEAQNTYPITPTTTGSVRDGYVLGEIKADPEKVRVNGPKSIIERIDKVVAEVDVTGLASDTVLQSKLVFYDADGKAIDNTLLTLQDLKDENDVRVQVEVRNTRRLQLDFDTSYITAADGYLFTGIETEPKEVQVSGSTDVLEDLDKIEIPASALNIRDLDSKEEVVVDITPYLPDGVELIDENAGAVVVTIGIEEEGSRTIEIPTGAIVVNNLQDGLQYSYVSGNNLEIKVQGDQELLDALELDEGSLSINLVTYKEPGEYDVPVEVKLPEGCSLAENVVIKVRLEQEENKESE